MVHNEGGMLTTLQTGTLDEISRAIVAATALTPAEVAELSALSKTHDDAKLRKHAKQCLDKHAPAASAALSATIKTMPKVVAGRGGDPMADAKVTKQLRALEAIGDFPDVPALAAAFVARTEAHLGLDYLCEHGGPLARSALQAAIHSDETPREPGMHPDAVEYLVRRACGHVLELDGVKRFPDELAQVDVRFLSLRNCGLKALPEPVLKLPGLIGLDLSRNKFTALPDEIAQLERLEVLVLQDVPLTRGLGSGLWRLRGLRDLDIMRATFTSLSEELGALTSLERLQIVQCKGLTSVPASISKLVRLRHLEIDHCDALTEVPESVWSLHQLEYIDVSGMKLGRLPDALGELRALKELQLRGCEVELPDSIGGCTSLATLDLVSAKITALPEAFYALSSLTRLRIKNSPLEAHQAQIESRMPQVEIFK